MDPTQSPAAANMVVDSLNQIVGLFQSGMLTEEEFASAKTTVLELASPRNSSPSRQDSAEAAPVVASGPSGLRPSREPELEPEPEPELAPRQTKLCTPAKPAILVRAAAEQVAEEGVPEALSSSVERAPIILDGHDYAEILDELEEDDLLIAAREEHCAVPPRCADSGEDYTLVLRSALKEHFRSLRELFAAVDADGSGGLDKEELADICSRLGIAMSADEVAAALTEMDTDGDGTADFREFSAWYKRVRAPAGYVEASATGLT